MGQTIFRNTHHYQSSLETSTVCCLQLKENTMKIAIDNKLVEITPESETEIEQLDALWKIIIDCVGSNKRLVPIGEYIPGKSDLARFSIED